MRKCTMCQNHDSCSEQRRRECRVRDYLFFRPTFVGRCDNCGAPLYADECPASKPEYLKRYEFPDKGLVEKLRLYGSTQPNGQMGDDCRIPKNVLLQAADRIEVLSGVRAASS